MVMKAKEIDGAGGRERTGVGCTCGWGNRMARWSAHTDIRRNSIARGGGEGAQRGGAAASAKASRRKRVATSAEQQGGR